MQKLGTGLEADRQQLRLLFSRFRAPLLVLVFAMAYGTVGYMVLEGFGFLNALYMTAMTVTTVGFGEIQPLSDVGRLFTISLMAIGVLAVFALVAVFTAMLSGGQLSRFLERRAMHRQLGELRDHYVICAYGRVGRAAAQELISQGAQVVVIEVKHELEEDIVDAGVPYILGDPTEDDVLEEAGITRAKGLLCAVDSDAINVYITLTARALNPGLFIISRASSPESVEKLRRAGSDRVISPYRVSGVRMASMALRPAMLEFVDMVSVAPDLRVEELLVREGSPIRGKTVRAVCAPFEGVMMLALRKRSGDLVVPPKADTVLDEGDVVIALGAAGPLGQLARDAG